jgi:hypothetical protein
MNSLRLSAFLRPEVLGHAQTGAVIDPFKLHLIHESSDEFESPTASFFRRFFRLCLRYFAPLRLAGTMPRLEIVMTNLSLSTRNADKFFDPG